VKAAFHGLLQTPRIQRKTKVDLVCLRLPGKPDSDLIFAGSILVYGHEQRQFWPEQRVGVPEYGLSTA
jgi:hypothetical protein